MIWSVGELLVEIMRNEVDRSFYNTDVFMGPYPSGAPAIFADTVAKMGYKAGVIGCVGKDDFGKCIIDRLNHDGVDCSVVNYSENLSTGVAFVTYDSKGDRKYIFHLGNSAAGKFKVPDTKKISEPKCLHLMGCSLGTSDEMYNEIVKTVETFSELGAVISFDPNIRKDNLRGKSFNDFIAPLMKNCQILLPGVEELLEVSECNDIKTAIVKMFENPKLKIIVLKNGSKGSTVYTRDKMIKCGVCNIKVADSTGAGDSFDAAFISEYLNGTDLEDCVKIASAAAALNTMAFGPMEGKITRMAVSSMAQQLECVTSEY